MTRRVVQQVCTVAVAILGLQSAAAQSDTAGASLTHQAQQTASRGPRAAIHVRGQWTLTIRNEDGTVASRVEFDNALQPSGGAFLSGVLGRRNEMTLNDLWRITISGASETTHIYEGTLNADAKRPGDFDGLTVTAPTGGPHASRLLLSGSAKATVAQSITSVATAIAHRNVRFGTIDGVTPFTGHVLSAPASVVPGQTIDVTVIVSFSAGNP